MEPQAHGGCEIHDPRIRIVSPVLEALPITVNKRVLPPHLDTFLDHAAVGLRHPLKRALFRVEARVASAFRCALEERDFTEITTPKLVASSTEGGANVFPVEYFGRKAYLAQSPQFYKQMMVGVFERVFEVGPVFRAEPHATARHLNEYVSLDAKIGFIDSHRDVMALLSEVVRDILADLAATRAEELDALEVEPPRVPPQVPSIYFPDAQELIRERFGEDCSQEADLSPQHERWLGDWARSEHGSDFLFVTGYPMEKRPFYTYPNPDDPWYSNSFDLLFRGMELVTGGQRLHRYDDYVDALEKRGMQKEPFLGYLEAFRYGMPPHGGFAIGLERFVLQLVGLGNLRETTLFPRDIKRLSP